MNKFKYIYVLIFIGSVLFGQDFSGYKFCINPGHGGHDSDDRYISETGFWESEGNLTKGLKVRDILESFGAEIVMTRTTNTTADDLALSEIVAICNNNNVDHMHSIHSNAYNGTSNYTLLLYQGWNSDPTFDEARAMSIIMVNKIYSANRTTAKYYYGDFDFYGTGQAYLGVFKGLTMPGQLSEGSFHDYTPESWRLQNLDYRKHEAWAIARSFVEYFEAGDFSTGIIAGLVRDAERTVDYTYLSGDGSLPINSITVTLTPGNQVYTGDTNNNGFFMFDSLDPGEYKVVIDAPYYTKDSLTVTVTANKTTFADKKLYSDSTYVGEPEAPTHVQLLVESATSVRAKFRTVADCEGYRVYYGTSSTSQSDYVESDTNDVLVEGLSEGTMYYFTIKSWNSLGESLDDGETYGAIPSADDNKVLIVNGFDRSTNDTHYYIRKYNYHLKSSDIGHSYCLNEVIYDDDLSLRDFNTVIWILGDESTADDTFNSIEQDSIEVFLQNGGRLFVTGSEIGWGPEGKSDHPTQADTDFYNNFLKANYVEDSPFNADGQYYSVTPVSGKIFKELDEMTFDDGTHGTYDVDWPDVISPSEGAIGCMYFTDATSRGYSGISYSGMFPDGKEEGKLVYLTFPFETIYPTASRQNVMDAVFAFFNDEFVSIDEEGEETIAEQFQLFDNYPNPFNPTNIDFSIPTSGNVKVKIFNLNGELVKNYNLGTINSGIHNIVWNATDNSGMTVAAGAYFYQVSYNNNTVTKKMLLLK